VILDGMTAPATIDAQSSIGPSTPLRRCGRVALIDRCMRRPSPARAVHRPRLTRPLREAAGQAVVTLVAPSGYGKTTLLCDWAGRDECRSEAVARSRQLGLLDT
jgi:hypothetical protein